MKTANASDMTIEELRRVWRVSDYMPAEDCPIEGILADRNGQPWVFFRAMNNWGANVSGARLKTEGQTIKMALRNYLPGEESPDTQPGDISVMPALQWFAEQQQAVPTDWNINEISETVRLPFKPERVIVVDGLP